MLSEDLVFWLLVAGAVGLFAWGGMQLVLGLAGTDDKLAERLRADGAVDGQTGARRLSIERADGEVSGLLSGSDYLKRLNRHVRQAFPEVSLPRFFAFVAGAAVALYLPVAMFHSVVAGILAAAVGTTIPFIIVNMRRNQRQKVLADQLIDALEFLSRILRAGHSLSTAFQMMGDELPEPIATEFRRCHDEVTLGQPIEQAMLDMAERADSTDFAFFVTSVIIQRQTGGDLAELLDNISSVIRNRIRLQQHVKALTAEGRFTAYLLTGLPPGLFVVLFFLNPDYAGTLIYTPTGRMLVLGMIVLQGMGLFAMKRIVTVKV